MVVTFPFVLLLLDFWPLKRIRLKNNYDLKSESSTYYGSKINFQLIVEKIPLFILAVIQCTLTFIIQRRDGIMVPLEVLSLKTRIANTLVSYVDYVLKTFWPHNLAYYYPYSIDTFSVWQICGAALLITSVIFGAIYLSRQYSYVLVGLFWYFVTLVPVIGLVQVSDQAMADRYTYIPLIGFFIIVAWGVPDILKQWQYRKTFLCVSAAIILSLLTTRAFFQTRHWKNSVTLFENAVKINENNYHALNNLVTALTGNGKYHDAFLYLNRALKTDPQKVHLRMNLANVLFLQSKPDKAISLYREILQTDTKNADVHYNLAYVLSAQGKLEEALSLYKETLRIDPEYLKAHYNLGNIYFNQGKTAEAFMHYAEIIKIKPDYVQAYNKLGFILFKQGKFKEAGVFFSKALQIDPCFSEARANLDIVRKRMSK